MTNTNINIIITDAGLAEIVNAEKNGTAPVILSEIGFGTGQYTPSAEQTALKNEFKRLTTVSGGGAGDNVLHVTAQDKTSDSYSAFEVGVYTDAGTLFAVCSQNVPIISKAAVSIALLSLDIVLSNINPESITVGDTKFVLNSATTEMQGIIELATEAEAKAATDPYRAIVPKTLDAVIENHDNVVHRSGTETISGTKTFTSTQIVRNNTPQIQLNQTDIVKGTKPETDQHGSVVFRDNNNESMGVIQNIYVSDGSVHTRIGAYQPVSGSTSNAFLTVVYPAAGNPYATAPTPVYGDNSTKIATTAWIVVKLKEYLPLAGGTMTGGINMGANGLSHVRSIEMSPEKNTSGHGGIIDFHFNQSTADYTSRISEAQEKVLSVTAENGFKCNGKNVVRSVNNLNANAAGNVSITIPDVPDLKTTLDNKAEKNHTHPYLPLAGGTMTGGITLTITDFLKRSVNDSYIALMGGSVWNTGANIMLFGGDHAQSPGYVQIAAGNGTASTLLVCKPDGAMTWGGRNIVRTINNLTANTAGNVTVKAKDVEALPISGGQMTTSKAIARNVNNEFLGFHGGTGENNDGAQLFLCGENHTSVPGGFQINARNSKGEIVTLQGELDGTLKWDDKYVLNNSFLMKNDSGAIMLTAASSASHGAYFRLYGKDHSTGAGQFNLAAANEANTRVLAGKPDGTLTWDGNDVAIIEASGSNYIRFTNGLQICWGTYGTAMTGSLASVTFPVAFANTAYGLTTSMNNLADTDYVSGTIQTKTTTGFTLASWIGGGWMAIGKWK